MHFLTYLISESYSSQSIAILLIDETLWAKKQFAVNLANSADALLVNMSLSYPANLNKFDSFSILLPFLLPIMTLSGLRRSLTAVPSAKNSGLLAMVYLFLLA